MLKLIQQNNRLVLLRMLWLGLVISRRWIKRKSCLFQFFTFSFLIFKNLISSLIDSFIIWQSKLFLNISMVLMLLVWIAIFPVVYACSFSLSWSYGLFGVLRLGKVCAQNHHSNRFCWLIFFVLERLFNCLVVFLRYCVRTQTCEACKWVVLPSINWHQISLWPMYQGNLLRCLRFEGKRMSSWSLIAAFFDHTAVGIWRSCAVIMKNYSQLI